MVGVATLRRILQENRSVAVVGLSPHWHRPSYIAAKYLLDHGYRVVPVNPKQQVILGQRCYPSLLDIPEPVDVVDLLPQAPVRAPIG
ncbi:MAG: CoA-binding protein [Nitrococcus sp.]|nr:CoA-binding protein [Nitrococcus sp.]